MRRARDGGTGSDVTAPPWRGWSLLACLLSLVAYPPSPPQPGSSQTSSSGLDETELLATVLGMALGPGPWARGLADGNRGWHSATAAGGRWHSERDYHGVRRGPFSVQRAALSLFASLLDQRCAEKPLRLTFDCAVLYTRSHIYQDCGPYAVGLRQAAL